MASLTFFSAIASGMGGAKASWKSCFCCFAACRFLSITPEVYNLRHQAINFVSMYRWDAEKRRVSAELSGPFKANPKFRYGLLADLRSENWDIRNSFQGPAPLLGSLNMRREAVSCELCFAGKRPLAMVCGSRSFASRLPQRGSRRGSDSKSAWPRATNSSK